MISRFRKVVLRFLNAFGYYRINHYSYKKIEHISNHFIGDDYCFLLKINVNDENALICIQKWLDVIHYLKRRYAFICDNKNLKNKVLSKLFFPDNGGIYFIKSKRFALMKYAKKVTYNDKKWLNMTCAHLTPFFMKCKRNNGDILNWHIDADDTLFILETNELASVLQNVEQKMTTNYDAISLDMWASMASTDMGGYNWTLGVALIRNSKKLISLLKNPNKNWRGKISISNIDGYFLYLHKSGYINTESFYVDNAYFIHCGPNITRPLLRPVSFWNNGLLHYPIVELLYGNESNCFVIPKHIIKVDIGLSKEKSIHNFNNLFLRSTK